MNNINDKCKQKLNIKSNRKSQLTQSQIRDEKEYEHLIVLIDRTSEIYRELISKNINTSSAYKIPDKLNNYTRTLSKKNKLLAISDLKRKNSSNEEKINVLSIMSFCRKTLTNKLSSTNKSQITRNSLSPLNPRKNIYERTSDFSENFNFNIQKFKDKYLNKPNDCNHTIEILQKNYFNEADIFNHQNESDNKIIDKDKIKNKKNFKTFLSFDQSENSLNEINLSIKYNSTIFFQNEKSNKQHRKNILENEIVEDLRENTVESNKKNNNEIYLAEENFTDKLCNSNNNKKNSSLLVCSNSPNKASFEYWKLKKSKNIFQQELVDLRLDPINKRIRQSFGREKKDSHSNPSSFNFLSFVYPKKINECGSMIFKGSESIKLGTKNEKNNEIPFLYKAEEVNNHIVSSDYNSNNNLTFNNFEKSLHEEKSAQIAHNENSSFVSKNKNTNYSRNNSKIGIDKSYPHTDIDSNHLKSIKNKIIYNNHFFSNPGFGNRARFSFSTPKRDIRKNKTTNQKEKKCSFIINRQHNNIIDIDNFSFQRQIYSPNNFNSVRNGKMNLKFSSPLEFPKTKRLANSFTQNKIVKLEKYKSKVWKRIKCFEDKKMRSSIDGDSIKIPIIDSSNVRIFRNQFPYNVHYKIFCRICKEDSNEHFNKLVSICECTGFMKFMHIKCSYKYIRDMTIFRDKKFDCEVCNQKFFYKIKKKYQWRGFKYSYKLIRFIIKIIFLLILSLLIKYILPKAGILIVDNFVNNIFFWAVLFLLISILYFYSDVLGFDILETWTFYNHSKKDNSVINEINNK